MKRKLIIKGRAGLFDIPSFIVAENDLLKIVVDMPNEVKAEKYRLIIRHGDLQKTYVMHKGMTVAIEPDWLKANAENIDFALAFLNERDEVIKDDYQIEPLKMQTLGGNFQFSAQVQELMAWQEEHGERLKELEREFKIYKNNGVDLTVEQN